MKIYSIIIICLTLSISYNLALHQENKLEVKELKSDYTETAINKFNQESQREHHSIIEDEFSLQVTGKEHRYLNTGISFIEFPEKTKQKECLVANAPIHNSNLSGS